MTFFKKIFLVLFVSVSFFSCKKEKKEYTVQYRIQRMTTGGNPFSVRYTTADGATKSFGPVTGDSWNSGVLPNYKAKQYVTLTLEGIGGSMYKMYIYTSSAPYVVRDADDNSGAQSIETKIEE